IKYKSCISVTRMVGLVFLEVARVSIRKLLMCVNLTKAVELMTRRTLEETLSLIDANDTAYIGELYLLYCERHALSNIVLGARQRVENMREQFGDSTHPHTHGALYQAEYD